MDKKKLTDTVITECFDDIQSKIKNRTATVSQDFISRGVYSTTVCTNKLLAVYYDEFNCRIDSIFSFVEKKALPLDWDYLETQLHERAVQIYSEAEATACQHLVNASLTSTIPSYRVDIEKRKKIALGIISNKIKLVGIISQKGKTTAWGWTLKIITGIIILAGGLYTFIQIWESNTVQKWVNKRHAQKQVDNQAGLGQKFPKNSNDPNQMKP
jgi:hypothetical protein